jgi:hypothetical protein
MREGERKMGIFLQAFFLALVVGWNPLTNRLKSEPAKYYAGFALRFVGAFLVYAVVAYLAGGIPSVGPTWGVGALVATGLLINTCLSWTWRDKYQQDPSDRWRGVNIEPPNALVGMTIALVVLLALMSGAQVMSWPYFQDRNLAGQIGKVEVVELSSASPTDPKHMRQVSAEQALFWMQKRMGGEIPGKAGSVLGSQFSIDVERLIVQKINGHLYWVAPLQFVDGMKWWYSRAIPFYLRMSAEYAEARAELIESKPMEFMPSAFFGWQLERHIFQSGYTDKWLTELTFEVNEEGQPFWIVTRTEPVALYAGEIIHDFLIVDPVTGEITQHEKDNVPEWIDLITPGDLPSTWVHDWGMLKEGYWASVGGQDTFRPTGSAVEVFGDDGEVWWHIGVTSSSRSDDSLVGFVHVSAKQHKAKFFRLAEPAGDESAAVRAVETALKNSGLLSAHPTKPIPYILYGRLAYVVPVIGGNGDFQRLGIVDAANPHVVALGIDSSSALRDFKSELMAVARDDADSPSSEAMTAKVIIGNVYRIASETKGDSTEYVLILSTLPEKLLRAKSSRGLHLPLTKEGDEVEIEYAESGDVEAQVVRFSNHTIESEIAKLE